MFTLQLRTVRNDKMVRARMKQTGKDRRFRFTAPLVRVSPGSFYAVDVPERISKAIGKRGPVPVSAVINNAADFTASLSPAGGGRHRLRLNVRTRAIAEVEPGDAVKIHITVLAAPLKVAIPGDLKSALQSAGVLQDFVSRAPGEQNHIVDWITRAVRRETREKHIQFTVEFMQRKWEKRQRRQECNLQQA